MTDVPCIFLMIHDESKSSKYVRKGSQQGRSVRQKSSRCHIPQGHHAGKRSANQFLRTAITHSTCNGAPVSG